MPGKGNGSLTGFSLSLIRLALVRWINSNDVYLSARKSMTLWFYIWLIAKRAKGVALIDSGAIKNFMNLECARWLKLPIKELKQHHPLFNVDGTKNKSRALWYYMDLQFKTGTQTTNQRFYLSDLGDHKAIFRYPWFAAFQPRVDWKKGWIDMSQLPIVLSAPNAAKAGVWWCSGMQHQNPMWWPPTYMGDGWDSQGGSWGCWFDSQPLLKG